MADREKIILNRESYPTNSIKARKETEEESEEIRPKRKAVAQATRVRRSFLQRLKATFNEGEPGSEVISYVVHDVIIPAAKSTLADLVEGAIDMVLFGGERNPRVRRAGGRSYVSYADMYRNGGDSRGRSRRGYGEEPVNRRPIRHDFNGVILESRAEAEHVLTEMALILEEYEVVSVGDLYDLVGIDSEFTDQKYGWTDLHNMSTKRVRDGWSLDMPRPRVID